MECQQLDYEPLKLKYRFEQPTSIVASTTQTVKRIDKALGRVRLICIKEHTRKRQHPEQNRGSFRQDFCPYL